MTEEYKTTNLTSTQANSTVTISTQALTPGKFGFITVLKDSAHTIGFYDGDPAAGGTLIGTKPASIAANTYWFLRPILKGLYAVVAASFAGDIVVGFK